MRKLKNIAPLSPRAASTNLTAMAYKIIRGAILNNEFKPGEFLSSLQLAKNMNMSRTPVREALNVLASEGLVDIQNGVGSYVKKLTQKEIKELYEVRIALECASLEAIINSSDKATQNKLDKLIQGWSKLEEKYQDGALTDLKEISVLDHKTHDFIVHGSKNSILIDLTANIQLKIQRLQHLSVMALNHPLDSIAQHANLLNSLKNKDAEHSIFLLKKHVRESMDYIFERMKKDPHFFS